MPERFKGRKTAVIAQGVEFLVNDLAGRAWEVENEVGFLRLDRVFVDARYMHKAVEAALRRVPSTAAKPSMGIGVTANTTPINNWPQRDGRKFGDYWFEDRPAKRAARTVTMDVNYWKCQVHDAFRMEVGDTGGLSFWGKHGETHRMFADHCNAESVQFVSKKYEANEWESRPGVDNHFFDCIVGCTVAASHVGIKSKESIIRQPVKQRKVVTL